MFGYEFTYKELTEYKTRIGCIFSSVNRDMIRKYTKIGYIVSCDEIIDIYHINNTACLLVGYNGMYPALANQTA